MSGIAPYTTALAEDLAAHGDSVTVVTTHPHYPEWELREGHGGWSRTEKVNGVTVRRVRHHIPSRPHGCRRLLSEISFGLRLLVAPWGRPDVVVMVSPALFASTLAMTRAKWGLRRPPVGLWIQDIYALGVEETRSSGGAVRRLIRSVENWTYRQADSITVIHERFRTYVTAAEGVSAAKVDVVRNWTHLEADTRVDTTSTRASLGWAADELVVLHAGAQGVKQDLLNVVDAARLADERSLPVRFVLVGDGSQRAMLMDAAEGVERIQFISPLPCDDFQHVLRCADVLLVNEMPGLKGMAVPSKLTSYFDSGRPVVAATDPDSTTADELAVSGGGWRVDPGEPGKLVDAVLRVGQDPQLAARLAAAGHAFRHQHLGADSALSHLERWIASLRWGAPVRGQSVNRSRSGRPSVG
ncbi:MAG: glycosyltransferase family 4 protein [Aeromicrobium sp.]